MAALPVETKVKAGSLGAAVAGVVDWLLVKYLFPHLDDATAQALILAAIPGILAFAGGWLAKHTPRGQPVGIVPWTGPVPPEFAAALKAELAKLEKITDTATTTPVTGAS
jgi:hypothetical protein